MTDVFDALADPTRRHIVESRRQGRETLYRVNAEPLEGAAAWIVRVGGEWDARLERLRTLVEGRRG